MKVIITERQYQTLLTEDFGNDIDNILKNSYEFTKEIVTESEKQFKQSFQFLLTYGAGIGSLSRPLTDYLQGKYLYLTPEEIAGLVVMAISMVYFQHKGELQKPLQLLRLKGQIDELEDVLSKAKEIDGRFRKILDRIGVYIYNVLDIPAYTFLLPIMPMIIKFITDPLNSGNKIEIVINGLLASALITLSASTIRKILKKISKFKK